MKKIDFFEEYARRSGMTMQQLRELGGRAEPCECGEECCCGWQIATQNLHEHEVDDRWTNVDHYYTLTDDTSGMFAMAALDYKWYVDTFSGIPVASGNAENMIDAMLHAELTIHTHRS